MNIDEQLPVLEYPQPGLDIIKELTSPRLIKSHLPYRFLPSDLHNGNSKVIYMARNPKDLVVSYYQFHRSLRTMSYRGTFQEFCRRFMNDKLGYGSWFEHVQEFWEHHMDANVLFLKYEDMHKDLATMVEQLVRFLGVSYDKAQLESMVEHCHQLIDQCCNAEALPVGRGRVGLWKDIFTVSMNEKFDLVYKQKMGKSFQFDELLLLRELLQNDKPWQCKLECFEKLPPPAVSAASLPGMATTEERQQKQMLSSHSCQTMALSQLESLLKEKGIHGRSIIEELNFQGFDSEGNGIIQPRELKKFLFPFAIPITLEGLKQLWARSSKAAEESSRLDLVYFTLKKKQKDTGAILHLKEPQTSLQGKKKQPFLLTPEQEWREGRLQKRAGQLEQVGKEGAFEGVGVNHGCPEMGIQRAQDEVMGKRVGNM
ncbi:Sulfotransferase 4A1 [Lamprotornis superbus]|uniref:Sulfotransferase n=1 Tax=Lamprotornis superbus TaxID=245042 RepID=A0A835TTC5_9PASS|nr:Sulfotransferase 4A1 [Lamprotornis superbus]